MVDYEKLRQERRHKCEACAFEFYPSLPSPSILFRLERCWSRAIKYASSLFSINFNLINLGICSAPVFH